MGMRLTSRVNPETSTERYRSAAAGSMDARFNRLEVREEKVPILVCLCLQRPSHLDNADTVRYRTPRLRRRRFDGVLGSLRQQIRKSSARPCGER